MLTFENMEELRQGIATTDLPQAFRDAVELTKSLSRQYLWIDSLCMIKDVTDQSDWERECPKMGGIHSGATVSIAASAAIGSDGGIFTSRDPLEITPCIVDVCNKAQGWQYEPCAVWAKNSDRTFFLTGTLLNKRAWVLQERLLAPRTVYFTERKVFWGCPQLLGSETDPYGDFEDHGAS